MESTTTLSHEDVASLWSTLHSSRNLSVCLREATGNHALDCVPRNPHQKSSSSLFAYCIELTMICDLIRASNSLTEHGSELTKHDQEHKDLCRVLIYLLRNLVLEFTTGGQILDSVGRTYMRTVLAIMCALHSLPGAYVSKEAEPIIMAARDLHSCMPKEAEKFRLFKAICQYLIHTFSYNTHKTQTISVWDDICFMDPKTRSDVIEQLVDCATSVRINSTDRVAAMVEICYMYWQSESYLVRSSITAKRSPSSQPNSAITQAIVVAIETRLLIQQYVVNAGVGNPMDDLVQSFQSCILFMPGFTSQCALDNCQCSFDVHTFSVLNDMRQRKPQLLQHRLQNLNDQCALDRETLSCVANMFDTLQRRWEFSAGNQPKPFVSDEELIYKQDTRHAAGGFDRINSTKRFISHQARCSEQKWPPRPNLARCNTYHSTVHGKSNSCQGINENSESTFNSLTPQSPPALSDPGNWSSSQHSRTESFATVTTSPDGNLPAFRGHLYQHDSDKVYGDSHKIVVENSRTTSIKSPSTTGKIYPEVCMSPGEPDTVSIMSGSSLPVTIFSTANSASRGRWGNLLRGKKDTAPIFHVPKFRFFASGKHMLLWTKNGGNVLDPGQTTGHDIIPIHDTDIVFAAGGSSKFVVVSRIAETFKLSIYGIGGSEKHASWDLSRTPGAIDLSRNDRYLAIKYTRSLHLYDLEQPGTLINHKLPSHDNNRTGAGNHLVSFAPDSQSFMASTRYQPERVYTYWSLCTQSATIPQVAVCSTAPFGNVEDHGLTSLAACSSTSRSCPSGFLSTFTEKGYPVILSMNPKTPTARLLRDQKENIGTRIHSAALNVDSSSDKANLVLVNQNNDVFWITDLFGRDTETRRVATLKRAKSLKSEIQMTMSAADEASIFWVDRQTQKGVFVKVGKHGGRATPVYFRLDMEPMGSG